MIWFFARAGRGALARAREVQKPNHATRQAIHLFSDTAVVSLYIVRKNVYYAY